ncbi:MAG: branched-chain amino acid ABC transporter permease [Anaerolineae bacterium]|nr:branched-chain amino acid ABC transporter permease [Anaerolineae bacterium]
MVEFFQHVVNGLMIGGIYALMGIGLTLIFGIMNVVNFSHGEFYMLGAFGVYTLFTMLGLPYLAALLLTGIIFWFFGSIIERLILRPLQHQAIDVSMLATIGLSIFLSNLALIIWDPTPKDIGMPFPLIGVEIGPITLTPIRVFIFVAAMLLILGSHLFLRYNRFGKAIRATFQDREAAALMGVNTGLVNLVTFSWGTAIAAIAGGLLGPIFQVFPTMGTIVSSKSFAVVIAGGLGNFPGAILSGLLLGVAESLGAGYVSSGYRDAIAFILIIVVLIVRPTGLLGKARRLG